MLDTIVSQFQTQAAGWESSLQSLALQTFGILAAIEMTWAGLKLAFHGADAGEWIAEILNQFLFLGFFLALLQNASTWGTAIVNSFRQAGQAAGGVGMAPSDVLGAGILIAQKVLNQMSLWHPSAVAALMLAAIVIIICFALIAAEMVVTLVQSYVCIAAGVINMAFGGSRWTKDIAVATVRYTLSVGAKLMMLQLLVSIGQNLITSWAAQFNDMTNSLLLVIIGASVVLLAVVKTLPNEFQRIVGGASLASGGALIGAGAAVGAGVGGALLGGAGATAMGVNAFRVSAAQMAASDAKVAEATGQPPERSRLGKAAALTGGATKQFAAAPLRDIGRRLSGDISARHGIGTWRMNADLANRRRLLADDANKPPPPLGGGGNSTSGTQTP